MIYCINPNCPNYENTDTDLFCQACGSELLLNGKYRVVKKLGGGGFGTIWEVNGEGKAKILKVLRLSDTKALELFEQEAKVLKKLTHPGIPKVEPDGYFQHFSKNSPDALHCIVMEKIEGANLEDWLRQRGRPIDQPLAIKWLKQLANTLQEVHKQKFFHRDIKPANVMLQPTGQLALIDFGTVKEITATYLANAGRPGTVVYSGGYAPTEQENGHTVLQSDFFALGRTFVHLLTGRHPVDFYDPNTAELRWRDAVPGISPKLADFIDSLMARLPSDRPANTQVILQQLAEIERALYPSQSGNRPLIFWLGLAAAVGLVVIVLASLIWKRSTDPQIGRSPSPTPLPPQEACSAKIGDNLSCGEESLFPGNTLPEKQQGIKVYADGQYDKAIDLLQKARNKQPRDPETLIYLNNARIAAQNADAYTIAVAAPLDTRDNSVDASGQEVLRGVAQVQNEINRGQKIDGKMLRVVIANDGGNADWGVEIAKSLTSKRDLLGVIGHMSSRVTLKAAPVYQEEQLVLISPTSTAVELSEAGDFFFRSVSSDRVTATTLANYLINKISQTEVAVFYDSKDAYSRSLQQQFHASFVGSAGTVVKTFDFSPSGFNARNAVEEAQNLGAKALVLLPSSSSRSQAIEIAKANNGRYCMVAGDAFYSFQTLELGNDAANHLVVATPWQRDRSPDPTFPSKARDLWQGEVSWWTALAYDATRALVAALEELPQASRTDVQKQLANRDFKTSGATGNIRFQPNGDRLETVIALTTVVRSGGGFEFVSLANAAPLNCDR